MVGHTKIRRLVSLFASVCSFVCMASAQAEDAAAPIYETIVKADRDAFVSRKDEGASVAVITRNRTARSGETMEQLVSELPGVAVTRYGGIGALATVSVRGSTPNQVQVYVDDIPLNLATGGGVDLGFIPVFSMQRLELFKGSSPVAFGSSGMGGVMSVSTQTPDHNSVHGSLGAGSWGDQRLAVSGSYAGARVRAFAAVSAMRWDGNFTYANNNGTAFDVTDDVTTIRGNNDLSQQDVVTRVVFPLGEQRTLSLAASLTDRDQGVPGGRLRQSQQARLGLGRQTAQVVYNSAGDLGANSRIHANIYVLHMSQRFRDLLGEVASAPTDSNDQHWAVGNTWRLHRAFNETFRLRGVLDFRHEQFSPNDAQKQTPSGPPGTRTFGAVGLEPSLWFARSRVEITPSARLEVSRDVLTSRNMFTNEPSASAPHTSFYPVLRASITQHPSDNVGLRVNVGRYVRAPSTTERYGNTGFIVPNPAIDPERGLNMDVGARFSFERKAFGLCADSALFASWVEDLIQFQLSGQGQARASNVGDARVGGAEAAVSATIFGHLRLFTQATYTRAIDTSGVASRDGNQLPLRPRARAYTRPELINVPLGMGLQAGIYSDLDYTAGNYIDPANLQQIPARLLWGAGAQVAHPPSGVRAVLSATNLTNASIFDLTGFPLPGRAVFMTLEWSHVSSPPITTL